MAGFNDYMTNYFNRASQGAVPPSQPLRSVPGVGFGYNEPLTPAGATSGTAVPLFGKTGTFGDIKPGQSADVRGFTATRGTGGAPDIVSGRGSALGMIDLLRTQGFTPEQATTAVAQSAGAELDYTKNTLLPGSTAADIANVRSQVSNRDALTGEIHADALSNRLTQGAQRGLIGAQVGLTGAQTNEQRSATTSRDLGVWTDPANGEQYQRDSATGRMFKLKGLGALDVGPR